MFQTLTSRVVTIPANDIDTDQIIPARFLKVTDRAGVAANLFADRPDWSAAIDASGDAAILLAGDNFGCGSSREHAPWALVGRGIRAVVSSSFADIFRSNALKNGLVPVQIDADTHRGLLAQAARGELSLTVDVERLVLERSDGSWVRFPLDPFARRCLLEGVDELGWLLAQTDRITAFEEARRE